MSKVLREGRKLPALLFVRSIAGLSLAKTYPRWAFLKKGCEPGRLHNLIPGVWMWSKGFLALHVKVANLTFLCF